MGKWLAGKIKYFFWTMVLSSVMMVGLSFSPKYRDMLKQLRQIKGGAERSPNALPSAADADRQVSASNTEKIIDDGNYVVIKGKYYKARADNTYMVDGEKVFYVNNRGPSTNDAEKAAPTKTASAPTYNELPTNPAEMMETLKQINGSMKARDKILEDLDKGH